VGEIVKKDIISFIKQKDFKLVKELGQGGLGRTVLVLDQEMGEQFVCKKYSPYDESIKDDYYQYFKNEIKVMFQLNHPNIVRIFNYYLYPEFKTGYILMEFIDGDTLYDYLKKNPDRIDYVFEQIVDAFLYLENHQILHRDVRRENILVSAQGEVKIIDFGFGKKVETVGDSAKSISLNWWCEKPNDFSSGRYDHCTELYFIGKLFEKMLEDGAEDWTFSEFKYQTVLSRMVKLDPEERISSFSQVKELLVEFGTSFDAFFTHQEKETYKTFANDLIASIASIDENSKYVTDTGKVIGQLESVYRSNVLEDKVQNTNDVIKAFLGGSYRYFNKPILSSYTLREFIQMFRGSDKEKKTIIMLNIQNRLNQVKRTVKDEPDFPF
jgi:eukaryotic-like serine/threonine-protein kinase